MKRTLMLACACLYGASLVSAVEFQRPVRLEAEGKAVRVESPGYAAPCWADIDGDGKKDLLVGQFDAGFGAGRCGGQGASEKSHCNQNGRSHEITTFFVTLHRLLPTR